MCSQNIHNYQHYRSQAVSNKIIILGLPKHLTETDVSDSTVPYFMYYISLAEQSIRITDKQWDDQLRRSTHFNTIDTEKKIR